MSEKLRLGVLLFNGFELLDVFGPLEMFGKLSEQVEVILISQNEKVVKSFQGQSIITDYTIDEECELDILMVPGGQGTRTEIFNEALIEWIKTTSAQVEYIISVCTGSVLLAQAGVLSQKNATTNKRAFEWVTQFGKEINWLRQARWVEDGKLFTSSGVSAGIDMSLAFIAKVWGVERAEEIAKFTEYVWNKDSAFDPFARSD